MELPKCHPIDGFIPPSGPFIKRFLPLAGQGPRTPIRSDKPVSLLRTDRPNTFKCPLLIHRKCRGLFDCNPELTFASKPEPTNVVVIDSSSLDIKAIFDSFK